MRDHFRCSRQSGQATVEFMLTAVFLVLLTAAVLEVADFVYTYSALAGSAKEGLRFAVVHGFDSTSLQSGPSSQTPSSPPCTAGNDAGNAAQSVKNAAKHFAGTSLHATAPMNVYVCYLNGNNNIGSQVEVTVSYVYQPFFFNWPSMTVFANAAGRIMY
jgi:Flp pilus assembly protein TadG